MISRFWVGVLLMRFGVYILGGSTLGCGPEHGLSLGHSSSKKTASVSDRPDGLTAFELEELRSERLRIFIMLAVLVVVMGTALLRVFVLRTVPLTTAWPSIIAVAFSFVVYELWTLSRVKSAVTLRRKLPKKFWFCSPVIESAIPGLAMVVLASEQLQPEYRPLAAPPLLFFFVLIILSTLRLSIWASALAGICAATSYLASAWWLGWRPPLPGTPASTTQTHVTAYALGILTAGAVAALVAHQIRVHVAAALREAETRKALAVVTHDLEVARSIQQSLLPQEPLRVRGFDIAGWNRSADDTGGDYFDWKERPDGTVVITLADVTGHGIGPAMLAAVCRAYARSSLEASPDLQTALEHINKDLSGDLSANRFVTFVAASCRPDTPNVEILSAGHGPLFVYSHAADRFVELGAHAVPFGILPSFHPDPSSKVDLHCGDLVLLATDGFFEWENERGEEFGVARMEEVIRECHDLPAPQILESLAEAVDKFADGSDQQDDLTAVVIKRVA